MEEKKVTKISLSTFLLILAIIAIVVMGVFIYKLNNDKTIEIQKSTELQSQVNSLNETINDLQGKITTISETITANSSNENNSSIKNSIEYQISGTYYQKNAQGDEPNFTFSTNNKVTYGALWTCSGTYTINNNTLKINFTSAVDPDGNKANFKDYGVKETVELTIIDDNNLKDNSDGIIYSKKSESNSSNNTINYQITGTYYQENAQGDEPNFTFSANNKVTYGALWTCSGTYTINNNTIKINFTSAVDPDGNKANVKDYGVKETVELTIINNNRLKDNSDGVIYSK